MLEDSLVGYMFSNKIIAVKIIFNGNIIRKKILAGHYTRPTCSF